MSTTNIEKNETAITAKQLLDMVRYGERSLFMHGHAPYDRPSYSGDFVFKMTSIRKEDYTTGHRESKELNVPGYVGDGHTSERETHTSQLDRSKWMTYNVVYRPVCGFWSFIGSQDRLRDVLELLPKDATVSFRIALDAGTNEYAVRAEGMMNNGVGHREGFAGLHTDHLYLIATYTLRGRQVNKQFLIDTATQPHNTSRFGSPRNESDTTGGR